MVSYSALLKEVRDAGLEDNSEIQKYLKAFDQVESEVEKQNFAKLVREKCRQHRTNPFPNVPGATPTLQNSLYLGDDWKTGTPYSLSEDILTQHVLIAAQSGGGKTNLIYQMLPQLSVPFWSFDLKQDYRHLQRAIGDMVVIPKEELRFNPLKPPPGVTWNQWKNRVVQVLCDATHLLDASQNFISQHLAPLYKAHLEDLQHPVHDPPTLHQLKKRIEEHKPGRGTKEYQYYDTVTNRLGDLTQGLSGQIFEHSHGFDLEQLLQRPVVFELDNLNTATQNFLMELLIEWQFQYRRKHQQRGGQIRHVIVADEGKQLFDKNKEAGYESGIPHISHLVSKIRTFGIPLVVSDQEAEKLLDTLKANTNTKIILPNSDHKQLNDMAASMGLHRLQKQYAQSLEVGEAVIKSGSNGPYRVNVNDSQVEENVTRKDVMERLQGQPFYTSIRTREQPRTTRATGSKPGEEPEQPEQSSIELSDDAEHLLKSIAQDPFKKITSHYDQCFNSRQKAVDAKTELREKDMLGEPEHVSTLDSRLKLFPFTENGREHLEQQGIEIRTEGRGGITHQYWQHRLSQKLEDLGWVTGVEKLDADIYAKAGDREIVVEVALTSRDREVDHVEDHLSKVLDKIVVGCENEAKKEELRQKLEENNLLGESVELHVLQQLLKDNNLPHP